jgi:hypothetical protein
VIRSCGSATVSDRTTVLRHGRRRVAVAPRCGPEINAAANICGVDVNVLILALQAPGPPTFTDCDARSDQDVTVTG